MEKTRFLNISNRGFSLVEVIVSLIVISLVGIVMLTFYDTQVNGSIQPVLMAQEGFALEEIMEKINADYQQLLNNDDLTSLTILEGKILALSPDYGGFNYTPTTQFITFDAGNVEDSTPCTPVASCTTLKVTITLGNQSLTTLFTR